MFKAYALTWLSVKITTPRKRCGQSLRQIRIVRSSSWLTNDEGREFGMKKFTDKTGIACEQFWIGHTDDGRNHGNTVEVLEKKFKPDEVITHNVGDWDKRLRWLAKHVRKPLINRELKALPGRTHAVTKTNFPKSCSNSRLEKCSFFSHTERRSRSSCKRKSGTVTKSY